MMDSQSDAEQAQPTAAQMARTIIAAAWPQATVVACRNLTDLTDVAVLGWLGTDELSAAAFAQMVITFSGIILWQGCGDALISLVAQAIGAGNPHLAGIWLQTSIGVICIFTVPIAVLWWMTGPILALVVTEQRQIHLANTFTRWSLLWLLPDAIFGAFCQWLNAQQLVRPTIVPNLMFVGWNLAANVLLVHGIAGWGGLGFVGSPLATASTKVLRAVVVWFYMCKIRQLHKTCWHPWTSEAFARARLAEFMGQALPNTLAGVLEQAQFVFVTLVVGSIGKAQLAAHTGLMNVFGFVSCGMYGLCDAGASTIGRHLGAGEHKSAIVGAKALLALLMAMGLVVATMFLGCQTIIGRVFSRDPDVWHWAKQLSILCGAAYVLLALTFACFGTLQGQGRPSAGAGAMFVGLWGISVPGAYVFGKQWPHPGVVGVWGGLVLGYLIMTLIMVAIVLRSDWKDCAKKAQIRSEKDDPLLDPSNISPAGALDDCDLEGKA